MAVTSPSLGAGRAQGPCVGGRADQRSEAEASWLYLIVHIPKCAGETIREHLRGNLGEDRVLRFVRRRGKLRFFARNGYVIRPADYDPRRIRVLTGHHLARSGRNRLPGRPTREIALIRDPLTRIVSHYNYYIRRMETDADRPSASFEEWYATQRPNYMTDFFLTRYLEIGEPRLFLMAEREKFDLMHEALTHFWYVADFRRCDEILAALSEELGISAEIERKNVTLHKHMEAATVPERLKARIAAENVVDQAIYDPWKDVGFTGGATPAGDVALSPNPFKHMARIVTRGAAKARLSRRPLGSTS
jgi:hypothetical protein